MIFIIILLLWIIAGLSCPALVVILDSNEPKSTVVFRLFNLILMGPIILITIIIEVINDSKSNKKN